MLCHRYKMPTVVSKWRVWEELDDDYNMGFEENYFKKDSFSVTYNFQDIIPKQFMIWVKRWIKLFNKNSKSPYFAQLIIDSTEYQVRYIWEGFENYKTWGKYEEIIID